MYYGSNFDLRRNFMRIFFLTIVGLGLISCASQEEPAAVQKVPYGYVPFSPKENQEAEKNKITPSTPNGLNFDAISNKQLKFSAPSYCKNPLMCYESKPKPNSKRSKLIHQMHWDDCHKRGEAKERLDRNAEIKLKQKIRETGGSVKDRSFDFRF